MPSTTTIRVCDQLGSFLFETAAFLEIGPNPGLHYVLSAGKVGALTATLPPEFNALLIKDARVHVMRSVNGGPAQRQGGSCFLIRRWDYGDDYTTITALHANDLMRRRCILYAWVIGLTGAIGAGNANKGFIANTPADNAIKRVWRENIGASVDQLYRGYGSVDNTAYNGSEDVSGWVGCAADVSAGPNISKQITWRNMLDVIQDIEASSLLLGTYLTAEVVAPTDDTLELRTYTGQRGADRRFSAGSGLIFSSARGNLANAVLTIDATEEITFAQALGAGPSSWYRYTGYAVDSSRIVEGVFNRCEVVYDSSDAPNDATLTNDARAAVQAGRPVIMATADIQETDQCVRGVDFDFGDLITVETQGIQYDMHLDLLDVSLSQGVERTQARFAYYG